MGRERTLWSCESLQGHVGERVSGCLFLLSLKPEPHQLGLAHPHNEEGAVWGARAWGPWRNEENEEERAG